MSEGIDRRHFMLRGVGLAIGLLVAHGPSALAGGPSITSELLVDAFARPSDPDDTPAIRRAIVAAARAGGGRVLASAGRVYRISPSGTLLCLNPSGRHARHSVCIELPTGVTLDMRGSTLQLQGGDEAILVANANLSGVGVRDSDVGLINVVLDGRDVNSTETSMLHLAYVDRLVLQSVKIARGVYQGGWIYNCRASTLGDLDADGFRGQPWTIGSPVGSENQIYDSTLGSLRAANISKLNSVSQPGNSFDLVLTRCTVERIEATNCAAGVKVQSPGRNIAIGTVALLECGDADGNSGLKLQGDSMGGAVTAVTVGTVTARLQSGPGLFMELCADCSIGSYTGVANDRNGGGTDVWIGGSNDRIGTLSSIESGGNGVLVRPYSSGYQLPSVLVRDPGKVVSSVNTAGVAVYGGMGSFGSASCVDSRIPSVMSHGFEVNSASATGSISALSVTGARWQPFTSVAAGFRPPAPT